VHERSALSMILPHCHPNLFLGRLDIVFQGLTRFMFSLCWPPRLNDSISHLSCILSKESSYWRCSAFKHSLYRRQSPSELEKLTRTHLYWRNMLDHPCQAISEGRSHCYTDDFKVFNSKYFLECGMNAERHRRWQKKECTAPGTSCIEKGRDANHILCGALMDQARVLGKAP